MLCVACTPNSSSEKGDVVTANAVYPVAEWDIAAEIIMHTPGEELFNGVIHPLAGLFDCYFDVEISADEHRNYIAMIEANNIKVHTVGEVLNNAPIEHLREHAKSVLVYDSMLEDDDGSVADDDYRLSIINQMSKSDLIRCILLQPMVQLRKTANNTGVAAQYIQSPLFNLYFTRDQSISTPKGHIICQMNSTQRAAEAKLIEFCYRELGIEPILEIMGDGRLEGGDYIPAGDVAFIGCGMRTNMEAIRQIMDADAFGCNTVAVVKDSKWWQMQMHLDTYFNIIDKDLCTLVESRYHAKPGDKEWVVVDLYQRSVEGGEYELSCKDIPFVEYLTEQGFEIITIGERDEMHYANNYLTIAPRHIMAVANQSEALEESFRQHGVKVEWVELENLIKGYGAAHCMTQVIRRIPTERD